MGNCLCTCSSCMHPPDDYVRCQCPRGCNRPVNQTPSPDPDWLYCNQCSPDLTLCQCFCRMCIRSKRRVNLSVVDHLQMTCYFATCIRSLRIALGAGPVGHACGCHPSDAEGHCLKTLAFYSGVRQLRLAIHSICDSDRFMLSDTAGTPCVLGTITTPKRCPRRTPYTRHFGTTIASQSITHTDNSHNTHNHQHVPDLAYATSGETRKCLVSELCARKFFQSNSWLYRILGQFIFAVCMKTHQIII